MPDGLTLKNLPTWLRSAPKEHRAALQAKWQYHQWLGEELVLPDDVWLAFIVPSELQQDPKVKQLRETGLEAFKKPENLVDITDPFAPENRLVSLCLVGMLYDLEQDETYLPYDSYQLWTEVADNFGMWRLRYHLEDAIFRAFDPENYSLFESVVKEKLALDKELVKDITDLVFVASKAAGVKHVSIKNRQKNVYGVYKKSHLKQTNLNEIYDIHGFRLLVKNEADCYRVMEAIHHLWRPFPDRQKDYIAQPKLNGYQSLHTTVYCLRRHPVEFQIRTEEMDEVAISGLANHAAYKKGQRK